MKKLFSVLTTLVLVMAMLPSVLADGAEIGGPADIDVTEDCVPPVVYTDPTERIWNPNDQTYYTADEYGTAIAAGATDWGPVSGIGGYDVPVRQNYAFTGETLTYYVAVYDEDGEDDINEVSLLVDGLQVGACMQLDETAGGFPADAYINDHMNIPYDPDDELYDSTGGVTDTSDLFAFYACTLIVQNGWNTELAVSVQATDGDLDVCAAAATTVESIWTDWINFNPTLALDLTGGPIDFGSVEPGSETVSNTVYLLNDAEDGSGVVMDMYIASDDYFTDPVTPGAICPTGNGIRYDQFRYYATKGSINSGANNNAFPALGETVGCSADPDEFTDLPSHSGDIQDMCHIVNHIASGSLLSQGSEMSVTFKLSVPNPCEGHFTDGEFHFVGRVV